MGANLPGQDRILNRLFCADRRAVPFV